MFSIEPSNLTPELSSTIEICQIVRSSLIESTEYNLNSNNFFKSNENNFQNNVKKNLSQNSLENDSIPSKYEVNFTNDDIDKCNNNKIKDSELKKKNNDYNVNFNIKIKIIICS